MGKEVIHIRKHSHSVPFTKHSLFINLFDICDPSNSDRSKLPKCFWITPADDSAEVLKEEALAFAEYKKLGGIIQSVHHVFDKPPTTPPAFQNMKAACEGGYGNNASGYDDLQVAKKTVCRKDSTPWIENHAPATAE